MDIFYLTVNDVLEIHEAVTGISKGVVRRDGLESAVAAPRATMYGSDLHPDLFTKAAALLRSLAQNHPFIDGNKRAAWLSMRAFLDANGIEIKALASEVETMMFDLVTGSSTMDSVVTFLYAHATFVADTQTISRRGDDADEPRSD